jgi:signal transduction histidine kinase
MADRDRILQVLSNLIGNAIKFTPAGGSIAVRVECCRDGAHVSVEDTGPGIAPEDLPHLFQPYWQAQHTPFEGAGLGLSIARGIVEAHEGRIWAESTPGQGSTFHFTIPTVRPCVSADERMNRTDRRVAYRRIADSAVEAL